MEDKKFIVWSKVGGIIWDKKVIVRTKVEGIMRGKMAEMKVIEWAKLGGILRDKREDKMVILQTRWS